MGYQGSKISLILPKGKIQGGADIDFIPLLPSLEDYAPEFAERGTVSIVGIVSAAFIIRLSCERTNQKTVVVGRVIDDFDILKRLATYGSDSGEPSARIVIEKCGLCG